MTYVLNTFIGPAPARSYKIGVVGKWLLVIGNAVSSETTFKNFSDFLHQVRRLYRWGKSQSWIFEKKSCFADIPKKVSKLVQNQL